MAAALSSGHLHQIHPGGDVSLSINYLENETSVEDGDTVLIGSDAASTIRIVRPGISRKHAVVSFDGNSWKVEDAGSRNGIFVDGQRIQTIIIDDPTTLYLGHPTDGEAISLAVANEEKPESSTHGDDDSIQAEIDAFVIAEEPKAPKNKPVTDTPPTLSGPALVAQTQIQPSTPANPSGAEMAELTAALRDQISSVKGLTWSVWAMIAVTAVLAVMTLFVGILSN